LFADLQIPPPGTVGVIRWAAVLIDQLRQPGGDLAQLRGPQSCGDAGQIGLGGVARLIVDMARQLIKELLDDPYVLRSDITALLGGSDVGQLGWQRLSGDCPPRSEKLGKFDAIARLSLGDPQPGGQHVGQRGAAQLGRGGFGGQPIDDPMLHGGCAPQIAFHPVLQGQQFGMGECIEVVTEHLVEGVIEFVVGREHSLSIRQRIRTHA